MSESNSGCRVKICRRPGSEIGVAGKAASLVAWGIKLSRLRH